MEDVKVHYDQTVRNSAGHIIQFVYGGDNMDGCYIEPNGNQKAPFNLKRMIEEFPKSKTELSQEIVQEELVKLFKKIDNCSCLLDSVREITLQPIKELLTNFFKKTFLNEKNFKKMMKTIYEKYERGMIQPSEMVGLVGGQSLGKNFAKGKYKLFIYTHPNCGKPLRALLTTF